MKKTRIIWMALLCVVLTTLTAFAAAPGNFMGSTVTFKPGDGKVEVTFKIPNTNGTSITEYKGWIYDENGDEIEGIGQQSNVIDVRNTTQTPGQYYTWTISSWTVNGTVYPLENGKSYKFKFAAVSQGETGGQTGKLGPVKIGEPEPEKPVEIGKVDPSTAEFIPGNDKISIKFETPESSHTITRYLVRTLDIEAGTSKVEYTYVETKNAGEVETLEVTGLEIGKSYKFQIAACIAGGTQGIETAPFPETPVICGTLPKPENVSVEPGVGEATVSFDTTEEASYYIVNVNGEEYKTKSSPVKVIGLDSAEKHSISVLAVNEYGNGFPAKVSNVEVEAAAETTASSVVINDADGYQTANIGNGTNTLKTVITNKEDKDKMFYLIVGVYGTSLEKVFLAKETITTGNSGEVVLTDNFGDLSGKTVKCFVWDEGLKPYNK